MRDWIPPDLLDLAYYYYDNAWYRRRGDSGRIGVDDVLREGKWVPCTETDRIAPVYFGSRVDESELPIVDGGVPVD